MSDLPENDSSEQLLTREQLAERWQLSTKTIDRYRSKDKTDPKYLKTTKITEGLVRFRLKDIKEHERRNTKHFLSSLPDLLDDDLDDLDPATGSGRKPNYP